MRSYEYPQASACFIQSVDDTMEDIMRLAAAEAMLFKYGSGTGTDLSTLRSSREKLSGGGTPSGPLSFMRIYDQVAGVIRSGGKTRRAAKMQSLKCDHPDIKEFIECKMVEEKKAWALIDAGYDGSLDGDAYASVMYQNANLSVRLTDEFMQACADGKDWQTQAVTTGEPMVKYSANELLDLIAEGTRVCGDPGVQYHSTVNRWHTCKTSGPINASNPCSEYMFLDDSACNLASLNLHEVPQAVTAASTIDRFRAAVRIFIIAQEILVDHSSYPVERICRNSHDYRPLGLGYANLGCLVMSLGLPYDSDAGRAMAAAITAIMTATAYTTSSELASRLGHVLAVHPQPQGHARRAADAPRGGRGHQPGRLSRRSFAGSAIACWDEAVASVEALGCRNAQVTVLAPTGTIGFMMDCDTTGIEPDIALVKYKSARRRRDVQDRQRHGPAGAGAAGLHATSRSRASSSTSTTTTPSRAPRTSPTSTCRLRLRVQARQRQAVHPLHGPHPHDGGGAAFPFRRDLQDGQHAEGIDGRGDPQGVHGGLEAGAQGGGDLPRRLEADPAAEHKQGRKGRPQGVQAHGWANVADRRGDARGGPSAASSRASARDTSVDHAQVQRGRARRLPDGRPVRGRPARASCS